MVQDELQLEKDWNQMHQPMNDRKIQAWTNKGSDRETP